LIDHGCADRLVCVDSLHRCSGFLQTKKFLLGYYYYGTYYWYHIIIISGADSTIYLSELVIAIQASSSFFKLSQAFSSFFKLSQAFSSFFKLSQASSSFLKLSQASSSFFKLFYRQKSIFSIAKKENLKATLVRCTYQWTSLFRWI
jgi:hypothetical protein